MKKAEISLNVGCIKAFNEVMETVLKKGKDLDEPKINIDQIRSLVDEYKKFYKILGFLSSNHLYNPDDSNILKSGDDEIIYEMPIKSDDGHRIR